MPRKTKDVESKETIETKPVSKTKKVSSNSSDKNTTSKKSATTSSKKASVKNTASKSTSSKKVSKKTSSAKATKKETPTAKKVNAKVATTETKPIKKKVTETKPTKKKVATTKKVTKKTPVTEAKETKKKTTTAKKTTTKSTITKTKSTKKKVAETKKVTKKSTAGVKETKKKTTTTKKATTKSTSVKAKKASKKDLEYYDLPYRYNETIVKILAQTPKKLFVYWDIADSDRQKYVEQFGADFFDKTKPALVIHNDSMNYTFEVEINDFANCWYLDINDANNKYTIELIRRPKNKNYLIPNNYIYIASSNIIESPNDHILFEKQSQTVYFRNVKDDSTHSKDIANMGFIKRMGKIYSIYDAYKKLYSSIYSDEDIINNPSSHVFKQY